MNKTRILALLLCLVTVLIPVSCAKGSENADTTVTTAHVSDTTPKNTTTAAPAVTTESPYDENGYLKDSLPEDLNFGGETITVLYWSDVEMPEFEVEDVSGDLVKDAIYERNLAVEERLGVTYEWIGCDGDYQDMNGYISRVQNSYNAGDHAFDICAAYSPCNAVMMLRGFNADLMNAQYLDYDKPWWPERLLETSTVDGSLYFVSGDISTNVLYFMYGIYYNRDMVEELQLTDPTEYVLDHQWTLDKMIEMTTSVYSDLDSSGTKTIADRYGMGTRLLHLDAFYIGCGMEYFVPDETALLKLSDDFTSEKTVNMVEKLTAWVQDTSDVYCVNNEDYATAFTEGRVLFSLTRLKLADTHLKSGAEFSYGVLPAPLYDETQGDYRTIMGNPFTLYSVMSDCQNMDMATAVLEAQASYGYRLTTPAIFETNMKLKYSADDVTSQMFDIIRNGVDFDLARFFATRVSYVSEMASKAIYNDTPWSSTVKANARAVGKMLERIVEEIRALK